MAVMEPEEALRRKMLSTSAITDLVIDRIYPSQGKFKDTYPLVLYARIDSVYFDVLAGIADKNLAHCSIQLDIFGKGYEAAKAVAKVIRKTINTFAGTITAGADSLKITRIRLTEDRDGFDNPTDGRPDGIYRVIQEYDIWFNNE